MTAGAADPDELMARLRGAGVMLEVRGDRLAWSAPSGIMTPALLAELQAARADLIATLRRADGGWLPLAAAQERLYLMARVGPATPALNVPAAVRVRGDLDLVTLGRVLDALVARHEALRLVFAVVDDRAVQRVTAAAQVPLDVREVSSGREALRAAIGEAQRPFDLSKAPTLRAVVLRISPGDHLLVLTFHHLTCDESSLRIALAELVALYEEHARGVPARLVTPVKQYSDHVAEERATRTDWDEDLAFWRRHLAGLPPSRMSRTSRTAAGTGYAAAVDAPYDVVTRLGDVALSERTTLFCALLTVLAIALGTALGRDDVVVGVPSNDRRGSSFEHTIGTFVNTLAVRAAAGSAPTFRDGVRVARRALIDGLAHSKVPYERVVDTVGAGSRRSELFDAWLVLRQPAPGLSLAGVDLEAVDLESAVARHELKLDLEHGPGGLRGALLGRSPVWEPEMVDRLAAEVSALLAVSGVEADAPLVELRRVAEEQAAARRRRVRDGAAEAARSRLRLARRIGP